MRRPGFTIVELVITLVIASIVMTIGVASFRDYGRRTAARRAADVFVRDLQLTRSTAIRERNAVAIVFDEVDRSYQIRTSAGRVVLSRGFGPGGEIPLASIDLELDGDSVPFDARGIAILAGAGGALAQATFAAGEHEYLVSFSALGAAEVTLQGEDDDEDPDDGFPPWK